MIVRFAVNTLSFLWYFGIVLAIYMGWVTSDQRYIVPENGVGYWLGIIGGSMMLLLLIYPVRKRKVRWTYIGSTKFWFRLHMIFGVVGPTLVIFHSGYELGSLNSRVAMFTMLIVAGSGLIGRYLYRHIHHGLYGEKVHFKDLYYDESSNKEESEDAEKKPNPYAVIAEQEPELVKTLADCQVGLVVRHTGINRSLWFYLSHRWKLSKLRKAVIARFKPSHDRREFLDRVWSLRSICNLGINEILFSYWHILHFPLFIMLVFSGIFHVIVVHLY
jgi:hypothetical protein